MTSTRSEVYLRIGDGTPVIDEGAWQTAYNYKVRSLVTHAGDSYLSKTAHISGTDDDEPGVGANWETYWGLFLPGLIGVLSSMTEVWGVERVNETPNGVLRTFTVDHPFVPDTEMVFWQGQLQTQDTSYTPTPADGEIEFLTDIAPQTGDDVLVFYKRADVAGVVAGAWHDAYEIGHQYYIGDQCGEAESGSGQSAFVCFNPHVGATNCNPTGTNGHLYWKVYSEGGINGVSDLTGSLDSLLETTAEQAGTALIIVKEGSTWKKIQLDNLGKRKGSIHISAAALEPKATDGCQDVTSRESTTNLVCYKARGFVHTGATYATFTHTMPDDWDGGPIKFRYEWVPLVANSNSIVMALRARGYGDGDGDDDAMGTPVTLEDAAAGTAYQFRKSEMSGDVTIAGTPAKGDKIIWEFYRPTGGADTYADTAYITDLYIEYTKDQWGC